MDNHERGTIEQILNLLHGLLGRDDAKADYRPTLTFIPDNPDGVLVFPDCRTEKEKSPTENTGDSEDGIVRFNEKEIRLMSVNKTFTRVIRLCGFSAHLRTHASGKTSVTYELRFRRDGYNISASGKTKAEAKARFIEKARTARPMPKMAKTSRVPRTFHQFALYYFENYRVKKVTPSTFKADKNRYFAHIAPYFKDIPIQNITPSQCQKLLDGLPGNGKTAEEIYFLLNGIFKYAIAHHLIPFSPTDTVFLLRHECKSGSALTRDEEKLLLQETAKTDYLTAFAVALYTGMRPNEYRTARIEGGFIIAKNSKRQNKRLEFKRIPISPMLRPYLEGVTEVYFPCARYMREKVKEILPNHKLYDLRTTFYTRCKECGVADAAREEFVGHSLGKLGNAYTDLSDEYLLKEGEKLRY